MTQRYYYVLCLWCIRALNDWRGNELKFDYQFSYKICVHPSLNAIFYRCAYQWMVACVILFHCRSEPCIRSYIWSSAISKMELNVSHSPSIRCQWNKRLKWFKRLMWRSKIRLLKNANFCCMSSMNLTIQSCRFLQLIVQNTRPKNLWYQHFRFVKPRWWQLL